MPVWGSGEGACTAPPTLPRDLRRGGTLPPPKGHPPSAHATATQHSQRITRGGRGAALSRVSTQMRATIRCGCRRPTTPCTSPSISGTSGTGQRPTCWHSTVPPPGPSRLPGEAGQAPRGPPPLKTGPIRWGSGHTPRLPPASLPTVKSHGGAWGTLHVARPLSLPRAPPFSLGTARVPLRPPLHTVPSQQQGTPAPAALFSGRVQDLSPSFLKRFEKVCRKYRLGPQNIISLSNQSRSHRLPHQQPWAGGRGAGASRGAPGSQGWGWRPQGGPVCEPALSSQITVSNTSRGTQPGLPVRELHGGAGGGGGTGCGGRKLDRRGPASANPTLPVPSGVVASEHTCQCPGATDWELCHHRIHSSQLWRPESEVKVQTAALLPEALAASAGSTHPCAYGRAPPVSALVFTRLLLCLCLSSSSL